MKKSNEAATNKERRRELRALKTARKQSTKQHLKTLTDLRRAADKVVASHRETDTKLARRIAILETRLS